MVEAGFCFILCIGGGVIMDGTPGSPPLPIGFVVSVGVGFEGPGASGMVCAANQRVPADTLILR